MKTCLENIFSAGDSLITELDSNKWRPVRIENDTQRVSVPVYWRYTLLTEDFSTTVKNVAGFVPDGFIEANDGKAGVRKTLYGVTGKGGVEKILTFTAEDNFRLVLDDGWYYNDEHTRKYMESLAVRRSGKNGELFEASRESGHYSMILMEMMRNAKKSILIYERHFACLEFYPVLWRLIEKYGDGIDIRIMSYDEEGVQPHKNLLDDEGMEGKIEFRKRSECELPSFVLVDGEMYIMENEPGRKYLATMYAPYGEGTAKTAAVMKESFERFWAEAAPERKVEE